MLICCSWCWCSASFPSGPPLINKPSDSWTLCILSQSITLPPPTSPSLSCDRVPPPGCVRSHGSLPPLSLLNWTELRGLGLQSHLRPLRRRGDSLWERGSVSSAHCDIGNVITACMSDHCKQQKAQRCGSISCSFLLCCSQTKETPPYLRGCAENTCNYLRESRGPLRTEIQQVKGFICNILHINISEIKYVLCEYILEK